MNIAIIGYGKMGKEIDQIAQERGHKVLQRIDENNITKISVSDWKNIDVAIEFSMPESAFNNINLCFSNNVPVVCGTTGWLDKFDDVIKRCTEEDKCFFYASNYSLGVNLFFKLNSYLSKIMDKFPDYNVKLEETHHTQKLDAPSGTAITLADEILKNLDRKNKWERDVESTENIIGIKSFREGSVTGNHKIIFDSAYDKILIEHDAKNRKGFATGAVIAAEFIASKKGYFTMDDLLEI